MTAQNRTQLKALFETGDTILQSSFDNLIDSCLNITDTSSQTINSPVVFASGATFNNAVTANAGIYTNNIGTLGNNSITISADVVSTGLYSGSVVNSAAARGTTRTSALVVSAFITVLKTVSAGTNDGIIVGKGVNGVAQYIINDTSATAKVYSYDNVQAGSGIDGTSVVQLFPNKRMTVFTMSGTGLGSVVQYTVVGDKTSV